MFKRLAKVLCASLVLSSVVPAGVMADDFSDNFPESMVFEEDMDFEADDPDVAEDEFADESESDVTLETELDTEDVFEAESEVLIESEVETNEELEAEALVVDLLAEIKIPDYPYVYFSLNNVKGGTYRFESYSDQDTFIQVRDMDTDAIVTDDDSGQGLNFKLVTKLTAGHDYEIRVNFVNFDTVGAIPFKVYRTMTYAITYDANGGSGAPEVQEVTKSGSVKLSSTNPAKYLTITYDANGGKVDPATKKAALPFKAWYTNKSGTGTSYAAGASYNVTKDVTLYAQYGTSTTAGTLATPQRAGYIFDGWYTAKTGGTKVTSSTTITGNKTVYAHWKADTKNYGNTVQGFVYRLYRNVLNRDAETNGMNYWVNELTSGRKNGAQAAEGFIHSNEFINRKLSDAAYIEVLYNTFLNRNSDSSGMNYWLNKLQNGMSRDYVFAGFVNSTEFTNICKQYGIKPGSVKLTEYRDQNEGVTMFIFRCYDKFLGRKADANGLNYWCELLLNGKKNAKQVAEGFVYSTEFQSRDLTDEAYVKIMYQGLFNRAADASGLNYWCDQLWAELDRQYVFYGFGDSTEFRKLAASFGLSNNWANSKCDKVYDGGIYTLIIPASWDGKYVVVKNGDVTSFCEKTNNAYGKQQWGATTYGFMFNVLPNPSSDADYPKCIYQGYQNGYYWYSLLPTDIQYDYTSATLSKNYENLNKDAQDIIWTFRFKRTK